MEQAIQGSARPGPLYAQVARTLKEEIVSGVHPVGALLPTEDELCTRFAVSRYTVREALRRLREDGLVSSRQGAGTVVVPPRTSDTYALGAMSINDLVAFAAGKRFDIDTIRMTLLDGRQAARVGVAGGEEWLMVRGFRYTDDDDVPACQTEYYINREFAAVGRLLQRHSGPIFPLIEDLFALTILEVDQEIGAVVLPASLADPLKVKEGSAALEIRRSYRIEGDRIAQVTLSTFPAARYRHSMTLRRVKA